MCQLEPTADNPSPDAPADLVARLSEDSSDPYLWPDYADSLAAGGNTGKADAAFDQAVSLGPNLPPVLIRAAYFAFTHNDFERGATLSSRILNETAAFDPLVFSYLHYFGQGRPNGVGAGVPASMRPARSWTLWIADNGSETEIRNTFVWMQRNRFLDQATVLNLTWKLWRRQFFGSAQGLWSDWAGVGDRVHSDNGDASGELLVNRHFEREPNGSPFDWSIPNDVSVTIHCDDGLAIHFLGTENAKLTGIQQSVITKPGLYRFSAVVDSNGLTTDQRPFFRIFDPANSNRLDAELPPIAETTPKSEIAYDFRVRQGTEAVTIELMRRSSDRFDNKIQGTLHVYEVSVARLGVDQEGIPAVDQR